MISLVNHYFCIQIVVVIGDGPSGLDICRDIVTVAKQVHRSTRYSEIEVSKLDNYENLWNHSKVCNRFKYC